MLPESSEYSRQNPEMEKYVTVTGGLHGPYQVTLQIENQSFVMAYRAEEREQALWYRDMLCIALARLVDIEEHPYR